MSIQTVRSRLSSDVHLRIGGIVVALRSLHGEDLRLEQDVGRFAVDSCDPDIDVTVGWEDDLSSSRGEKLFDSGAVWKLFRENDEFVFDFRSSAIAVAPYKKLCVDSKFRAGRIVLNRDVLAHSDLVSALEYPADELLITNYLAQGFGAEVHGCGLVDSETGGHLFLGHSGAGKSTTTRLWRAARHVDVLSDDRIILRLHDGQPWMYGTPWHGEAALSSPSSAPIKRIFILKQGHHNRMAQLPPAQAVGELLARSFPPFHRALALDRTVEFLSRVVETVPCYQFTFIPDMSAV